MKYTALLGAKTKGTNICIKNDLAGRSEPGHLLHQVGCKGKNIGHGCIWPEFFYSSGNKTFTPENWDSHDADGWNSLVEIF
jgi:hypothetical protein